MKPTLALSMIVRNGGSELSACLQSARPVVDEIVIADTGSTDSSIVVAQSFGARVITIPWTNDFAAARNEALRPVESDWVLILDADEQLDEQALNQITPVLQYTPLDGCLVTIRNYVHSMAERLWDQPAIANDGRLPRADHFAGYLEHRNVRLFRNKPEIYFEGRVHETVGTRIEKIGGRLAVAPFVIHHFGFSAAAEKKAAKNILYRELGRQKIQEMPGNAQAYLELGLVELDNFHNDAEAAALFAGACELDDKLAVAWFFRGLALARLQREAEALPCLSRARQLGVNTAACSETEADCHYNSRQFSDARQAYRRALKVQETPAVLSKLGLTELRMGQTESGLKKLCLAITQDKSTPELYDRLVTGLLHAGRTADAARAAEAKLQATKPSPSGFLRAAAIWRHAGDSGRALHVIQEGLQYFPQSNELAGAHTEVRKSTCEPSNAAAPALG